MKLRLLLTASLLASCALVACGGGPSGGGPIPNPSTQPSVTYRAKLVFTGALAGHEVQSDLREVQSLSPMDDATPIPIMVVEPPEISIDSSVYGGDLLVEVSPQPSASPTVIVTQTNADATVLSTPTPAPNQTPQPMASGVIADVSIKGANVVQGQSAGTATAAVGEPVNAEPTAAVYSYMSIALDCGSGPGGVAGGSASPYSNHFGWKYNGTTWVADDNVGDADIYVDGPSCVARNSSETYPTIHIPGGDTRLSTDTPFSAVSASQWSNSETSFVAEGINGMVNPDGSLQALVVGKTRDGSNTFKMFPNAFGNGMFGAIEVSGSGVDGF